MFTKPQGRCENRPWGFVGIDHPIRLIQNVCSGADIGYDLNGFPPGGSIAVVQTDAAVNRCLRQGFPHGLKNRIIQL